MDWAMGCYGGMHRILIRALRIGWCCFVRIVPLLIILWIVWMGSRLGEQGLVHLWDSCCEFFCVVYCNLILCQYNCTLFLTKCVFNVHLSSDHGFDCICTLFHLATVSSYLCVGGTYWYMATQTSLQLAFFMAQWVRNSDDNMQYIF